MSELVATAERLRAVKNAFMDFITLWAIDRLMAEHRLCDRIHADVIDESENTGIICPSALLSSRRMDD